jgi:SAM-dependent methyltransferase
LKEKLLTYLVCPSCAGELSLSAVEKQVSEIITGELRCRSCDRAFAIVGGVPRFADLQEVNHEKQETAANFGWQWTHFTQEDSRYAEQYLGWLQPVTPEFFRDKVVLEGGCGKGRHTQLAAGWGAKEIIGIDLSAAVETAYAATRELPNAHVVQADIYNLPFRKTFDYAFSIGVLHHLPDPKGGFESLASKVKPGGHISAWVYGAENNEWITRWVNPVRQKLTSRMDQRALLQLSKIPAASVYLATKLIYGPLNNSRGGANIARYLFYNDYLKAIAPFGWREQHTIVFDHLVAPTAFYLSRDEFEMWWRDIEAEDVVITWHNRNSWCGFGRIPELTNRS